MEDQLPALLPNETAPTLSPGLKKLLTEGEDGAGACRLVAINPKLRAEAERMLPVLQAAKEPASRLEILEILVRRAPQYGITSKEAGEWSQFFADYLEALDGLPAYAIEEGFLRWNRGEGHANLQMASFYPKSGQLYQLAQKGKSEIWMAAGRARKALEYAEAHPAKPKLTEEERRQNSEAIRALASQPLGRLPPQPPGVSLKDWAEECRKNGTPREPAPARPAGQTPQQMAEAIRAQAASVGKDASNPGEKSDIAPAVGIPTSPPDDDDVI